MTEPTASDVGSAQRRARRDFIRAHHPDAGGNHDDFITGLADLDAGPRPSPAARPTPVTVVSRSAWPVSLTTIVLRRIRRRYQEPRVR
jgi:hypothetical protein